MLIITVIINFLNKPHIMSAQKRKSSVPCCVVNCKNTSINSPGVHFYRFPTANIQVFKRKRREDWIAAVKRKNPDGSPWQPHISSRICSKHFVGNEKSEDPRSPSYNPTIFPSVYRRSEVFEKSAIERYHRVKKKGSSEIQQLSTIHKSSKQTSTATVENVYNSSVKKTKCEIEDNFVVRARKIDKETQVNFPNRKILHINQESFICIRYMYINLPKDSLCSMCDVELQVDISEATT